MMSLMRTEVCPHRSEHALPMIFWSLIENWSQTCDRVTELIESNELAQMNSMDLQTYSKLIRDLDSTIEQFKQAIVK